jgi:hypothetical protein
MKSMQLKTSSHEHAAGTHSGRASADRTQYAAELSSEHNTRGRVAWWQEAERLVEDREQSRLDEVELGAGVAEQDGDGARVQAMVLDEHDARGRVA